MIASWMSTILDKYYQETMPKRIVLVRMGKTHGYAHTSDAYDQHFTSSTPEHTRTLTEAGVEEALKAGDKIKAIIGNESTHFIASPYRGCIQVGNLVLFCI